jgi:hypothetical protein
MIQRFFPMRMKVIRTEKTVDRPQVGCESTSVSALLQWGCTTRVTAVFNSSALKPKGPGLLL